MAAIPVAGVSAGDQLLFNPDPLTIENTAVGAVLTEPPAGIDSLGFGNNLAIYREGEGGAALFFEFVDPYTDPAPTSTSFVFGTPATQHVAPNGIHYSQFGNLLEVENAAQAVYPPSIEFLNETLVDGSVSQALIVHRDEALDFSFVDAYASPTPLNTPFYFGPGLVVSGVSVGNTLLILNPVYEIEGPWAIFYTGIEDAAVGQPRVGDQPDTNFLFVDPYEAPPGPNTPFYFPVDVDRVIAGVSVGDSLVLAVEPYTFVENFAHAIVVPSIQTDPVWLYNAPFGQPVAKFSFTDFVKYVEGSVNFVFTNPYNPGNGPGQFPPALNVPFYFELERFAQLVSVGDQLGMGQPSLPVIQVDGVDDLAFGGASLANLLSTVTVGDTLGIGTPNLPIPVSDVSAGDGLGIGGADNVDFGTAQGDVVGWDSFASGTPQIDRAMLAEGIDSLAFNAETNPDLELFVSFYVRYVELQDYAIDDLGIGTLWASYSPRYLDLFDEGIESTALVPYPTVWRSPRYLEVIQDSDFLQIPVQHFVHRNEQYVLDVGDIFEFQISTANEIYNFSQYALVDSQDADFSEVGTPLKVINRTQYVEHTSETPAGVGDPDAQYSYPKFGTFSLALKNKTIIAQGFSLGDYFKYGTPNIKNNARLIEDAQVPTIVNIPPRWESDLFVDFRIRYLDLAGQGQDHLNFPYYFYDFHYIYNSLQIIDPIGVDSLYIENNTTRVFDPAQFVTQLAYPLQDGYGVPSLGFSPRYIELEQPGPFGGIHYGIASTLEFGEQWASFVIRTLAPEGFDTMIVALPSEVYEQFTIIEPHSFYTDFPIGNQTIYNVTPNLYVFGISPPDVQVGILWASFSPRDIALDFRHSFEVIHEYGNAFVSNRDRTMFVQTINSLRVGTHEFTRPQVPGQPVAQMVDLNEFNYGIGFADPGNPPVENEHVSLDTLVQGSPYDVGDIFDDKYGTASVQNRDQYIEHLSDWPSSQFQFDSPQIGFPPDTRQYVDHVGWDNDSKFQRKGYPTFSPTVIYCSFDVPEFYKDNWDYPNGTGSWDFIDTSDRNDNDWREKYGTTEVRNATPDPQIIATYHNVYSKAIGYGTLQNGWVSVEEPESVLNFIRTLTVQSGIYANRFGYPEFPTNKATFVQSMPSTAVVPEPTLDQEQIDEPVIPTNRSLTVPSLGTGTEHGTQAVENLNREIYPAGTVVLTFGGDDPDRPVVYHYPRGPKEVGGDDHTEWGTAWVSRSPRYVDVDGEGVDSFIADYDPLLFAFRLKVRHVWTPLYMSGIDSFEDSVGTTIRNESERMTAYQIPPPRCIGEDIYVSHV